VVTVENPVIDVYMRMKQRYGADIMVDTDIHRVRQVGVPDLLEQLNKDDSVHGIIVQLPLEDTLQTDQVVNMVDPQKDVDGLNAQTIFDPATAMAIMWLLA